MTMNILFIAPYTPSPIRVRPYQFIRHLARRGHTITLVCVADNGPAMNELCSLCRRVIAVPIHAREHMLAYMRALPSSLPFQAAHCLTPAMIAAVVHELRRTDYDLIHIEHLRAAEIGLAALRQYGFGPPIVLDAVDSISLLFERTFRRGSSLSGRLRALIDLARTRHYEAAYRHRFAAVFVTSPEDAWALKTLNRVLADTGQAPVMVVPNGVDLNYFQPYIGPRQPANLIFTGKMSYHANEAAARYLVEVVMPHVWAVRPEITVTLAGAEPGARIRAYATDPRITVTGAVPDLRPYLTQATIAVAPIRYGVGVQNKVLEAMATATPVIAARQATVALHVKPDRDLIVADEAVDFADAILNLLADPERRARLGSAGRAYVEQYHDWQQSVAQLEANYYAMTVGRSAMKKFSYNGHTFLEEL
ncbi:glycosyltransferase [Chloroflexus sp. MS-G]|jgi:glycosyltransferase involved in cell wall biosynthesis|uniref:glycosyltransferase n=1 Tax=Chloroflexus sp. MS-G TaxID=1521187 RepID=UPI000B06EDE9|nr:glycosyltransferase [Chloroflexus sp. MS-G]